MTRGQFLKELKLWFKDVFINLPEYKVEELFSDFECDKFELHKPYFISPRGKIFTDISKSSELSHGQLLLNMLSKINTLNSDEMINKLTDKQNDKLWDIIFDKFIAYLLENLNWTKVNSGTTLDENNPYIILPSDMNYNIHAALLDFLSILNQEEVVVYGEGTGSNITAKYNLKEYSPEEIMDRIDTYFRTGTLLEKKDFTDKLIEEYIDK